MSRASVLEAIRGLCSTVPGVVTAYREQPVTMPDTSAPFTYLEVDTEGYNYFSFGPDGLDEDVYTVAITIVLGGEGITPDQARDIAVSLAEPFRAVFSPRDVLAALVYDCQIAVASDNLKSYVQSGDYPAVTIALKITEYVAANASAQS